MPRRRRPITDSNDKVRKALRDMLSHGLSLYAIADLVKAKQVSCSQSRLSRFLSEDVATCKHDCAQAILELAELPWRELKRRASAE